MKTKNSIWIYKGYTIKESKTKTPDGFFIMVVCHVFKDEIEICQVSDVQSGKDKIDEILLNLSKEVA